MSKKCMRTLFFLMLLLLPTVLWKGAYLLSDIWWVENITRIPSILAVAYIALCVGLLSRHQYRYSAIAITLSILCFYQVPTSKYVSKECINPLTIVQYNLYYTNPDIGPFLTYLTDNNIDLVVLQETAPWHGDRFMKLIDDYPYQFGGSPTLGYPSGQMIMSKQPISLRTQSTPAGHIMITGVWQSSENLPVSLYTAHPPSPRTRQLWYERNALIGSLERLADDSPNPNTLIIGDFNLSANTERFKQAFEGYTTAPISSWPIELKGIQIPTVFRIAIDHLWLRSRDTPSLFICQREIMPQFTGSDHAAVITYLSRE